MYNYIGIDISKSSLQIYIKHNDTDIELENSSKGLKQLYSKLKKTYKDISSIVFIFEPTGSYSSLIQKFCYEKSIKCFIVKPSQSSAFAKTIKNRSKTDLIDSRMLYRMHKIAAENDIKIPSYDKELDSIKSYMTYYKSIVKERVSKNNQLEASLAKDDDMFVVKRLRAKIKALKKEEKEILDILLNLIKSNPIYAERFDAIVSFKGIGNVTGIVLFELFMKYKDASSKEIIALCGLDPIQISSGSSVKRKSCISKQGSRLVRSTLFMGVLIAINHNPHMRDFYDRLKHNGKHSTVAQIAVMRKMIVIAFSLFKNIQKYDINRYKSMEYKMAA